MWQEPVSTCRLEKAIILVFTLEKKKVKPVCAPIGLVRHCSCFSALLSSRCAALKQIENVGWWHSIRPPATPSHLDQADRGAQLQVGKMGVGEWVWVPGPSLLAASLPHPTPLTPGKKCILGGVGHWSTWWVVSEEKPQKWGPFCTTEGTFALASLLQMQGFNTENKAIKLQRKHLYWNYQNIKKKNCNIWAFLLTQ